MLKRFIFEWNIVEERSVETKVNIIIHFNPDIKTNTWKTTEIRNPL